MRTARIVIAVLAGAFIFVFTIGTMISRHHVTTSSIRLDQTPRTVWRTITNFSDWPTWNAAVREVRRGERINGHQVWVMVRLFTETANKVVEKASPSRLVTRIADPDLPYGGTWTWEIEPEVRGCKVTLTEDGEVYNPVLRFASRFFSGHHQEQQSCLKALARSFGEDRNPWTVQ